MTGLRSYLEAKAAAGVRCPACFYEPKSQGHAADCTATPTSPADLPRRLAEAGMAQASQAHPDERAAVDAAIARLAATGEPFSSNDARSLHNVRGPVVGAAFQAAAKSGLIVKVGFEASTEPATHGHPVATWRGRAA